MISPLTRRRPAPGRIAGAMVFCACAAGLVAADQPPPSGVAVLQVDVDRRMSAIDPHIYGQFLEHINHAVVDGLYAEQVRGAGFEGTDFTTYWTTFGSPGAVTIADVPFERGVKSLRIAADRQPAGVRQDRVFLESGRDYDGSVWIKPESGAPRAVLRIVASDGTVVATRPLTASGSGWQEAPFAFSCPRTDRNATLELSAAGGTVLLDFVSLMRADVRRSGMLRPDLLDALRGLGPTFIRWPGGSFASTYKWEDGIGPPASRVYHPNEIWGGYSDYYGFGTDEYMALSRQLGSDPLIVLPAPDAAAAS